MGISSKFLFVALFATVAASASPARRTVGLAGNEKLAGILEYKGGFQADITLKTSPGEFVKYFRIAMPSFCTGADVLEAATVTSGQKDPAKLNDKSTWTFEVNGGAGQRVDSILVTMNGPSTAACTIPVYLVQSSIQEPDPDPDPEPGIPSSIQLCNNTWRTISVAVGFRNRGKYQTQGWFRLASRRCSNPALKGMITNGEVLVHGVSTDGTVWGIGQSLCVSPSAFTSTGEQCRSHKHGFYWAPFSRHVFAPGAPFTVLFQ